MRWFCVVPFMLLSAPAFAQQGLPAQVYACANIDDAGQRHACFDALVPELKKAGGAPATKAPPPTSQVAPAQSPLTAPVLSTAEAKASRAEKNEVDRVSQSVKTISTGGDGKYRFTLENGQVWKQLDTGKLRNLGDGPWKAEIRKASMGSYLLAIDKQPAVRVERVN